MTGRSMALSSLIDAHRDEIRALLEPHHPMRQVAEAILARVGD